MSVNVASASHASTHAPGGTDSLSAMFAPLASPAFTGNPTAPTPTAGDNDTSIATTAFVHDAVAGVGGTAEPRAATLVVAAANSTTAAKAAADYVCTGTSTTGGDEATINTAIAAIPSAGGRVLLAEGTYWRTGPVVIDKGGVILEGQGWGPASTISPATGATGPAGVVVGYSGSIWQASVKNLTIQGGSGSIQSGTGHGLLSIAAGAVYENLNFQYIEKDPMHFTVASPNAAHGNLSSALSTGGPITSIAVSALATAIPAGKIVVVNGTDNTQRQVFTTTGAAQGATAIPVSSATPVSAFPIGSVATWWNGSGFPYLFEVSAKECSVNKCSGNGIFIDPYYGSCEFTLMHFDGGDDSNSAGAGILCLASETKFNHCHPYHFTNGYQIGNSAGTCFPAQITIIGGEAESNTSNGILAYNLLVGQVMGVMFYDNGAYDFRAGGGTKWVDVIGCSDVVVNSSPTAYVKIDNSNRDIRFANCTFNANPATGFDISGSSVTYIKVRDTTVTTSATAINLGTAQHCEVVSNKLSGSVTESSGANTNAIHDNDFLSGSITLVGAASQRWRNNGITNSPAMPNDVVASLSGTTPTLVAGCMNKITLSGNTTFALPTAVAGASFTCKAIQPASGGPYTWTVTSADWGASGLPSGTTTASKADLFVGYCDDGSTWQLAAVGTGGF